MSEEKRWDNNSRFVNSDGGITIDNSEATGDWLIRPKSTEPIENEENEGE
jgi:hypothetical protein